METMDVVHCENCENCFRSRRSETGYACTVWGHGDFACAVPLDGFCHKAKAAIFPFINEKLEKSE